MQRSSNLLSLRLSATLLFLGLALPAFGLQLGLGSVPSPNGEPQIGIKITVATFDMPSLISLNGTLALVAGLIGAGLGFALAWMASDPILGVFVGLGLLITLQLRKTTPKSPMHWSVALALLFAMLATIAAYVAILYVGGKSGALL